VDSHPPIKAMVAAGVAARHRRLFWRCWSTKFTAEDSHAGVECESAAAGPSQLAIRI
jgi:aminoglycoside phosphotransferase